MQQTKVLIILLTETCDVSYTTLTLNISRMEVLRPIIIYTNENLPLWIGNETCIFHSPIIEN